MKFYCVTSHGEKDTNDLLAKSCRQRKIDFVPVFWEEFNFTEARDENEKALLYRASTKPTTWMIEKYLTDKQSVTFYQNYKRSFSRYSNTIVHQKLGVSMPRSIDHLPQNKDLLKEYVDYLGGFPIIIKAMGRSQGVGVMKIDSLSSLMSVVDYLTDANSDLVLREFVDVGQPIHSYRAVVLGDKVEIAYKNINTSLTDDFRSNVDQENRQREIVELSSADQKMIVKSVSVLDLELGAVDFAYNQDEELKIFEVNFPFHFVPIVKDFEYNINDKIVEYLLNKAEKD